MRMISRWIKDNRGFTLAELITAGAVLGLVAAGGATTYARYMRSSQEMDLRDAMTSLRKEVETSLTLPNHLTRSILHPENQDFRTCFGGALTNMEPPPAVGPRANNPPRPQSICRATDPARLYPLVLLSPSGSVISGGTATADGRRATVASRVLSWRGETCAAARVAVGDPRCEIELTTSFRAVCAPPQPGAPPADSCVTPTSVELFFTVRQLTGGNMFRRGVRFPSMNNMSNPDGTLRERVDALRVKALDFMRPEIFECPSGQTFKGFDENGLVQCGYQENPCSKLGPAYENWIFHRVKPDGTVECKKPLQGEDCSQGDPLAVFRGVDAAGNVICERPKITDAGCADGFVLTGFDSIGKAKCVRSVIGKTCPQDKFLIGYDEGGNPRCVDMKTPSGRYFMVRGATCGHNSGVCRYGSPDKPPGFKPTCPEGTFFVEHVYQQPRCCATCGWVGQWWCDRVDAKCSPYTDAKWQ